MNCGGTTLFNFQRAPGKDVIQIPETEFGKITRAHSLPEHVDPEITAPTTWTVEYRLPFEILKKYCSVTSPAPGVVWRANFYKCGRSHFPSPLADMGASRFSHTQLSFARVLRRIEVRIDRNS